MIGSNFFNLFIRGYNLYLKKVDPIKYAQKIGVSLGTQCRLNGSPEWGSEPWLIQIGNHTEISFECAFITHDGATWVFREEPRYSKVLRYGKIIIGNNCFIGARSTILPGVTIGDNSIIGAESLVTKDIPAGEIWGGVPARYIGTTTDFAEKCLKETPLYDEKQIKINRRQEIERILNIDCGKEKNSQKVEK